MTTQHTGESGTSIAEIMVVMTIGMLLLAMTVPAFRERTRSYNADVAGRQVLGELQNARMLSLSENVRFQLVVPASGSSYTLQRRDPVTLAYADVESYTLPQDITFTATVTSPEFVPTGLVNSPGSIVVQNDHGLTHTVIISAIGSMRVE